MSDKGYYYDIAFNSLNKKGEELCGDKVEIFKSDTKTIIVLADGLGSGVKANILATLTSKIAGTMLQQGESLEETIDTILKTLPVCQERNIAYSTFGIIEVDNNKLCKIIEYDNPPVFFIRNGKAIKIEKEKKFYQNKRVYYSEIELEENDTIILVSDGVVHAGIGQSLNHGWEWTHVAEFLGRQNETTSEGVNRKLLDVCNKLYEGKPGDDTTAATFKVRKPQIIDLFTGPPEDESNDSDFVQKFIKTEGKRIVCGGTAAKIIARELKREIETTLDYYDDEVPPIAYIKGIDLVTEGVLTLKRTIERLEEYRKSSTYMDLTEKDGATRLVDAFVNQCTHINLWVGRAINPAHQNPNFPIELSIKLNVVDQLVSSLESIDKIVTVNYI